MNIYDVTLYVIEGSKNSERIDDHWVACSEEEALGKAVMEYKSKHMSGNFRIKDFKIDIVLKKQENEEEMSKKVEIDIEDAKKLLEVCYPSAGAVCHRLAHTIEEAEREEDLPPGIEIIKVGSPKHVTQLDGRIDQLENRVQCRLTEIFKRLNDLEDLHRELRRAFTTQAELTQKILDIK